MLMSAAADHLDVIEFTFNGGCGFSTYMQIVKDCNAQWGVKHACQAEVLMPIRSNNLQSMHWVGRTKDAAAFGKAWETRRDESADTSTVAGKLWARFLACSTNVGRRGYDIH